MTSEADYLSLVQKTLVHTYKSMESMLEGSGITEEMDEADLTTAQRWAVDACNSIEEEWLLDPVDRAAHSIIQWEEDDND